MPRAPPPARRSRARPPPRSATTACHPASAASAPAAARPPGSTGTRRAAPPQTAGRLRRAGQAGAHGVGVWRRPWAAARGRGGRGSSVYVSAASAAAGTAQSTRAVGPPTPRPASALTQHGRLALEPHAQAVAGDGHVAGAALGAGRHRHRHDHLAQRLRPRVAPQVGAVAGVGPWRAGGWEGRRGESGKVRAGRRWGGGWEDEGEAKAAACIVRWRLGRQRAGGTAGVQTAASRNILAQFMVQRTQRQQAPHCRQTCASAPATH